MTGSGTAWHSLELEKVFEKTSSSENGLTESTAQKMLLVSGPNTITEEKKTSALKIFFDQFKGLLVIVLIIAGLVSFAIGDFIEGIAIFAILVINAFLGFFQEFKAEKSLEALKKLTALNATVIRDGVTKKIDAKEVVPGDIVLLHTGDKVPADTRIFEAANLKIDEAVLTGESKPASKDTALCEENFAIADRTNMAYANTIVSYGRGKGVVIATGHKTEFGKIATMIKEIKEEDTPLKRKLEKLGKFLVKIVTAIIAVLFVVGIARGSDLHEMFKIAVSLGVAAIPEGLPVVVTLTLSIGVFQMAKKNALTRRMPSVETLGSTTVICSDKTGTLTRNEMVVEKIFADNRIIEVTGTGYFQEGKFLENGQEIDVAKEPEVLRLLEIAAECNDAEIIEKENSFEVSGDPTEGCLVVLAKKAAVSREKKRLDEIPFESERKMMTTIHETESGKISFSKGAVEKIVSVSDRVFENGKISKFSEEKKNEVLSKAAVFAKDAYRILGFSFRETGNKEEAETGMVFVGFACLLDPPREGVREALETAREAGIKVKIITGDNPITTAAVAKKLGFEADAITGQELDSLDELGFELTVQEKNVFARVSPEHKLRIVSKLKELGEIVAVTGDGVNDAPALKKADIGIAMGIKGTDVSKEASDLILKDDNFATIVVAVREGRRIYNNIKSFVKYLLAANIGEVMIIGLAIVSAFPLPLLPLQLLWLNIVTDSLPALALGTEESAKDEMKKKPRKPTETVLDNTKQFIAIAGITSTIVVFLAFFYGLQQDTLFGATLDFLNTKEGFDFDSKARTMAFTTLIVFELLFVFSCRHENKGVFSDNPFSNRFLLKMVALSFALQVFILYLPQITGINVFDTAALSLADWGVVFALSSVSIFVPYIDNALKKISKAKTGSSASFG